MVEKIKRVDNPLTIIAIFAGLAEVTSTIAVHSIDKSLQCIFIVFLIGFPTLLLILFFLTLNFNPKVLYAPSDYKEEKNFVNMMSDKGIPAALDKLKSNVIELKTENNEEQINATINEIERIKEKSQEIPINYLWDLNHWGSNCASIQNNKMTFTGTSAPNGTDGSNININDLLEIGKAYEVSCFVKSFIDTTGMFQLWCHDQTDSGISKTTEYKVPSQNGERICLVFQPKINKNIRIHLQYTPGKGQIEVSEVKITELLD